MLKRTRFSHLNEAWAHVLVDRLVRGHGVRDICIAPGSRSAPLALAAARCGREQPELQLHSHFDERGLAYFALGLIKATGRPVAVFTTSGTAVANLHPAMVEAFEDHRPLIAVTADRPDELHGCGANQTTNQHGLFGAHCRGELQLPAPDPAWSAGRLGQALDAVLALLHGADAGPVHINAPFREPLYGTPESRDFGPWLSDLDNALPASPASGEPAPPPGLDAPLLLVAGQLEPEEAEAVLALARRSRVPILADIGSQLRLTQDPMVLESPDLLLASPRGRDALAPVRQIVQFGGRLTGKRLGTWLAGFAGTRWLVSRHSTYLDPSRKAIAIQADIPEFCRRITLPEHDFSALHGIIKNITLCAQDFISEEFSEPAAARIITEAIPPDMALFAGNSLSIRLLDLLAVPRHGNRCVTNRGASGIDGVLATACGFAQRHSAGLTLLLGDLSLLHDLNSLALAARATVPLVIVVLNNDGGGIFHLLPAREHDECFEPLFQLPHGFDFRQAAGQFGIRYTHPESPGDLRRSYANACTHNGCTLIELRFPSGQGSDCLRELARRLAEDRSC